MLLVFQFYPIYRETSSCNDRRQVPINGQGRLGQYTDKKTGVCPRFSVKLVTSEVYHVAGVHKHAALERDMRVVTLPGGPVVDPVTTSK